MLQLEISILFFRPQDGEKREIFDFVKDLLLCVDLKLDGKLRGLWNGGCCAEDDVVRRVDEMCCRRKKLLEWV